MKTDTLVAYNHQSDASASTSSPPLCWSEEYIKQAPRAHTLKGKKRRRAALGLKKKAAYTPKQWSTAMNYAEQVCVCVSVCVCVCV